MKLVAASFAIAAVAVLNGQQSPLEQPQPLQMVALVPLQRAETFLLATRIASAVRVPLGFEQTEPLSTNAVPRHQQPFNGISVRQAFNLIVQLDPRYEWRDIDGVAVFRPKAAWTDTHDVLNRRVENVALDNVTQAQASDVLLQLLFDRPSPVANPRYSGPTFSARVNSGTVLDVLNEAVKAGGLIWNVDSPQSGQRQVTLRTFEGAGTVRNWPVAEVR